MASSRMLRRVALVRTDVSEKLSVTFQKTPFFIVTAVKTSHLPSEDSVFHGGDYEECRLLDVAPCGCWNGCFGATCPLVLQGRKNQGAKNNFNSN
jgi:hypothetical protein